MFRSRAPRPRFDRQRAASGHADELTDGAGATTAQDFAKLGLLFLRGGEWDGEQILPEEWVEFCRTPSPANPEYGAHWWLDPLRPGVFYAVGIRGNVITVDPAHDLVIVQLGTIAGSLPLDQTEAILDAFAEIDD
jgi:CubicO group peptidase (beta-lactamase class C family)